MAELPLQGGKDTAVVYYAVVLLMLPKQWMSVYHVQSECQERSKVKCLGLSLTRRVFIGTDRYHERDLEEEVVGEYVRRTLGAILHVSISYLTKRQLFL